MKTPHISRDPMSGVIEQQEKSLNKLIFVFHILFYIVCGIIMAFSPDMHYYYMLPIYAMDLLVMLIVKVLKNLLKAKIKLMDNTYAIMKILENNAKNTSEKTIETQTKTNPEDNLFRCANCNSLIDQWPCFGCGYDPNDKN